VKALVVKYGKVNILVCFSKDAHSKTAARCIHYTCSNICIDFSSNIVIIKCLFI